MGEWYIGEIRAFSGGYTPEYWLPCYGQSLQIRMYSALYSLLGTKYGGDGINVFQIPNLNGAFVLGAGVDQQTNINHPVGETTNRVVTTLAEYNMPQHIHTATFQGASTALKFSLTVTEKYVTNGSSPGGNILAKSGASTSIAAYTYTTAPTGDARLGGVTTVGGSYTAGVVSLTPTGGNKVSVMPPFTAVTYMIATMGLFPARA